MATGDNMLTAISVGRECNIIEKEKPVYFGDVSNDCVVWQNLKGLDMEEVLVQNDD
jgi:cation-transporting ATPase 13A3/4/5